MVDREGEEDNLRCEYIISGDRDLPAMGADEQVQIVTARVFLDRFQPSL